MRPLKLTRENLYSRVKKELDKLPERYVTIIYQTNSKGNTYFPIHDEYYKYQFRLSVNIFDTTKRDWCHSKEARIFECSFTDKEEQGAEFLEFQKTFHNLREFVKSRK